MTDSTWYNIMALSQLPFFSQLPSQISDNEQVWKQPWYDQENPE
jgi:hypothetical protein